MYVYLVYNHGDYISLSKLFVCSSLRIDKITLFLSIRVDHVALLLCMMRRKLSITIILGIQLTCTACYNYVTYHSSLLQHHNNINIFTNLMTVSESYHLIMIDIMPKVG
jgi:hypothetical protein